MDARIKEPNRPDRSQERQDKAPPRRPGGVVFHVAKHPGSRVQRFAAGDFAHGQRDHGRHDQSDVDEDGEVLDFGHDAAGENGAESVDDDQTDIGSVYDAVGGLPLSITGDRDTCEDQRREGVYHPLLALFNASGTVAYSQQSKYHRSTPGCCCIPP